jgi:hypothetical protein
MSEDAKNITFANFTLSALRSSPFSLSQSTTFISAVGDCNSSKFQVSDVFMEDIRGTIAADPIASFQCSAAAPCKYFTMLDMNVKLTNGTTATGRKCSNLEGTTGFNCTGAACSGGSATGGC